MQWVGFSWIHKIHTSLLTWLKSFCWDGQGGTGPQEKWEERLEVGLWAGIENVLRAIACTRTTRRAEESFKAEIGEQMKKEMRVRQWMGSEGLIRKSWVVCFHWGTSAGGVKGVMVSVELNKINTVSLNAFFFLGNLWMRFDVGKCVVDARL